MIDFYKTRGSKNRPNVEKVDPEPSTLLRSEIIAATDVEEHKQPVEDDVKQSGSRSIQREETGVATGI